MYTTIRAQSARPPKLAENILWEVVYNVYQGYVGAACCTILRSGTPSIIFDWVAQNQPVLTKLFPKMYIIILENDGFWAMKDTIFQIFRPQRAMLVKNVCLLLLWILIWKISTTTLPGPIFGFNLTPGRDHWSSLDKYWVQFRQLGRVTTKFGFKISYRSARNWPSVLASARSSKGILLYCIQNTARFYFDYRDFLVCVPAG